MLNKAWLIFRLLLFVFTIRYAVALSRCIPEYAWSIHPSYLVSPSTYFSLSKSQEVDRADQVRTEVNKLYYNYEHLNNLTVSDMSDRVIWMGSVDSAIWKLVRQGTIFEAVEWSRMYKRYSNIGEVEVSEGVFANEAARKEFFSAYDAYIGVAANIAEETNKAYRDSGNLGESLDLRIDAFQKSLDENEKRHHSAVRELISKIPAPSFGTADMVALSAWRDSVREEDLALHPWIRKKDNPCLALWEKRYGDKTFAQNVSLIVNWFIVVWLISCLLRLADRLFLGTYLIASLQGWVLGHLWSIYYDAPRHVILWLLRVISPREAAPNGEFQ